MYPDSVGSDVMVPTARQPYTLCGVLYHHGEFASGGHYSVDVLHPNGDGGNGEVWLRIDDDAVGVARHEDVFGGQDTATEQAADERSAYILFYCRTAATRIR
jgi:ubiquitin carboxyl-terminal hydrolase 10